MVSDLTNNISIVDRSTFTITAGAAVLEGKVLWPTNANITSAKVCTYNHRAKPPQQCAPTVDVQGPGGEFLVVMTVNAHGQQPPMVNSISGDGCCNLHKFAVGEGRVVTVEGDNFVVASKSDDGDAAEGAAASLANKNNQLERVTEGRTAAYDRRGRT